MLRVEEIHSFVADSITLPVQSVESLFRCGFVTDRSNDFQTTHLKTPMAFHKNGYKTSAVHVLVPMYLMVVLSDVLTPTAINTNPWGSGVGAPDGAPW